MNSDVTIHSGLEGVVAAETGLSGVNGEAGELVIAGFPLGVLAPHATFEETVYLLWYGKLPNVEEYREFRQRLAAERTITALILHTLRYAASQRLPAMDALRMAAGTLSVMDGIGIIACLPTIVAAYSRMLDGKEPIVPRTGLGHTACYLYMMRGTEPTVEEVRGLETYLNTVIDHGLNASTFTARVIISTGSDLVSAIVGGVGALKGPLHGGAPGPALDMIFEIGTAEKAEEYLRAKIERGERLMGFGHRIYKVRDPRADVLAAAAERLFATDGDANLYRLAQAVEKKAIALLEEYKPGRRLQTNVEFYTALLLHGLRIPVEFFTPTFALSRAAGWVAHCLEQQRVGRLIRPASVYNGQRDATWVPMEQR